MANFPTWCDMPAHKIGPHQLNLIISRAPDLAAGVASCAAVIPQHYASKERVAEILKRLNKPKAAAYLIGKLPTLKGIRSGDLGEILATEYVAAHSQYQCPINRLRWKDHRNMAMRGDDLIGLRITPETGKVLFLKGEAKSRVALTTGVVQEARANLDKDDGLPAPHALSFVSDRLAETGRPDLATAIDNAQLGVGISPADVRHLLFAFSGNAPTGFLETSLSAYSGPIEQIAVGLRVVSHGKFVSDVYSAVIDNANNDQ